MKQKLLVVTIALGLMQIVCAQQYKIDWGTKFALEYNLEEDMSLVMVDNYNHYLFSDIEGFYPKNIIIRKFDQKCQLVNNYTFKYPEPINYIHRFEGLLEAGNNKIAAFISSYSLKEKIYRMDMYVFDKTTASFSTIHVADFPFSSGWKIGNSTLEVSENKQYACYKYVIPSEKKLPQESHFFMFDVSSLTLLWKNAVSFDDKFYDKTLYTTNSGKAVLLRAANGFTLSNYLMEVTADKQQKTNIEEVMVSISKYVPIGTKDYIVAFNYPIKGLGTMYGNLGLMDLETGKMIGNNRFSAYSSEGPELKDILFRGIFIQNDEISVFTEGQFLLPNPPATSSAILKNEYKYDKSYKIVMGIDGLIKEKETKQILNSYNSKAYMFHSYGLACVKGAFYINTGTDRGIYNLAEPIRNNNVSLQFPYNNNDRSTVKQFINQLFYYKADTKSFILCYMDNKNMVSLINLQNLIP